MSRFENNSHLPKEYLEHKVFSILEDIAMCYEDLSFGSIGFLPSGYKCNGIINPDTYIASSICGTIDSMNLLLKFGRINDALAILRKYYDEVMFDIYQCVKRQDYDQEDLSNLLYVDNELQTWREGVIRVKGIKKIEKYLHDNSMSKELMAFFDFKEGGFFRKMREYLDENIHLCSFIHLIKNDNCICNSNRLKYLDEFVIYLTSLFRLHLASQFIFNGQYLMASEYRDYLDLGETPPIGCENWMAPWAQNAFNQYIKSQENLAEYIKKVSFLEIV